MVTIKVGNPLSLDFKGVQLYVKWNRRFKVGDTEWAASQWSKDLHYPDTILAGHWTQLTFAIPETDGSEFEHFQLSMAVNTVVLIDAR